jgi:bleomycin hydrolase
MGYGLQSSQGGLPSVSKFMSSIEIYYQNYGVVPRDVFPETFSATSSAALNKLLKTRLREHALILRRLSQSLKSDASLREADILLTLRSRKERLMSEVWTVLSTTLGSPPRPDENFVWDYVDSAGKVHSWEGTPVEFFQTFTSKQYPVRISLALTNTLFAKP